MLLKTVLFSSPFYSSYYSNSYFGYNSSYPKSFWLAGLYCTSTEDSLFDCPRGYSIGSVPSSSCDYLDYAGLRCSGTPSKIFFTKIEIVNDDYYRK